MIIYPLIKQVLIGEMVIGYSLIQLPSLAEGFCVVIGEAGEVGVYSGQLEQPVRSESCT